MSEIEITDHGFDRARERLGIKRKAVARAVATAWESGIPVKYGVYSPGTIVKAWRGARFVFAIDTETPRLVTVLVDSGEIGRGMKMYHEFRQYTNRKSRLRQYKRQGLAA